LERRLNMANTESTMKTMLITLTAITLISAASLAYINQITKAPIEKASITKKMTAISEVIPGFDNNPLENVISIDKKGEKVQVYTAQKSGITIGYAIESFSKNGYSGTIKIMVGIDTTGRIIKALVTEHKETPGLGDKLDKKKSKFVLQFEGKKLGEFKIMVKKDKGDVDAITASTISSRAFCEALNLAVEVYGEVKK